MEPSRETARLGSMRNVWRKASLIEYRMPGRNCTNSYCRFCLSLLVANKHIGDVASYRRLSPLRHCSLRPDLVCRRHTRWIPFLEARIRKRKKCYHRLFLTKVFLVFVILLALPRCFMSPVIIRVVFFVAVRWGVLTRADSFWSLPNVKRSNLGFLSRRPPSALSHKALLTVIITH